jgi:hypothetical protein
MNEIRMDVLCIAAAFKISRWPRLISFSRAAYPMDPETFHDFSLAETLPQEEPRVAKAVFSIRPNHVPADGIRQFYLEAGVGPLD